MDSVRLSFAIYLNKDQIYLNKDQIFLNRDQIFLVPSDGGTL